MHVGDNNSGIVWRFPSMDGCVDELTFYGAIRHPTGVVGVLVCIRVEDVGFELGHRNRNKKGNRKDVGPFRPLEFLKNNTSSFKYPD